MRMCKFYCNFAHKLDEIMAIEFKSEDLHRAHEWIAQAKHIVITTHMAPDGDAMGSSLALWHWISNIKFQISTIQSVHVIVPNAFPAFFNWMPGSAQILIYEKEAQRCDALIAATDLFICTDFNDHNRIGPMGEKMLANPCP